MTAATSEATQAPDAASGKAAKRKPKGKTKAPAMTGVIALRLKEKDQEALEQQAAQVGKTLSAYARERLTGTIETHDRQPLPPDRQRVYGLALALRRTVEEMRLRHGQLLEAAGRSNQATDEDDPLNDVRWHLPGFVMYIDQVEADACQLQHAAYDESDWRNR